MLEGEMKDRMKELLKSKGFTQKDLAKRSGCTEAAISLYIKGERKPNSETLANIATVLGTTSDYLLGKDADYDSVNQLKFIISKNAKNMSNEDKMELIKLLME